MPTPAQITAAVAQEKLDLLFVERREDLITLLAYRVHQAAHDPSIPAADRPSWADSQKLAADHIDGALAALKTAALEAAQPAPVAPAAEPEE